MNLFDALSVKFARSALNGNKLAITVQMNNHPFAAGTQQCFFAPARIGWLMG
jgi:ribosomal protein L31